MPICGDYLGDMWGCCMAQIVEKIKDLVFLFGGYEIKV